MKIAHIIGYIQPEMGYEEHYTAKWQAKMGHDVHVITSDRIYPFKGISKKERYRGAGIFKQSGYIIHRLNTWLELPNELIIAHSLLKAIKSLAPDFLYIHGGRSPMQFLASRYANKNNIPYVADHHQYDIDSLKYLKQENNLKYLILSFIKRSQEKTLRNYMNKYVYNNSLRVFPVSKGCKTDLVERLKIPEDKMHRSYGQFGNTVSSTIPIGLKQELMKSDKNTGSRTALLLGFGVGLSWASNMLIKVNK